MSKIDSTYISKFTAQGVQVLCARYNYIEVAVVQFAQVYMKLIHNYIVKMHTIAF